MDHDPAHARRCQEGARRGSNFDAPLASSNETEALAKASIFQATSEKALWKDNEEFAGS